MQLLRQHGPQLRGQGAGYLFEVGQQVGRRQSLDFENFVPGVTGASRRLANDFRTTGLEVYE
jgi:hypothetical protein